MWYQSEALRILRDNGIPFHPGVSGFPAVLCGTEVNVDRLRRLGFRISGNIEGKQVISFRGSRLGLLV